MGRIARRVRQSFNDGIKTSEQGRSWWWRACLLDNLQRDVTCQWEERFRQSDGHQTSQSSWTRQWDLFYHFPDLTCRKLALYCYIVQPIPWLLCFLTINISSLPWSSSISIIVSQQHHLHGWPLFLVIKSAKRALRLKTNSG